MLKQLVMFGYSLVFILTIILSSGFLNIILPYSKTIQNLGEISVKWQYFTEHKDDYNAIFLGPSTTYFGVVPKLFDEYMTTEGKNVKSFNFGISGANVAEIDFYLQKILELKPANLKWIFLDCSVDLFTNYGATSAQEIYWHTPGKTLENFKLILESSIDSWPVKVSYLSANFQSFIYRWLGLGQFANLWQEKILNIDLSNPDPLAKVSEDKLLQESGYYAIDWQQKAEKWQTLFRANGLNTYLKNLKKEQLKLADSDSEFNTSSTIYGVQMMRNITAKIKQFRQNNNKVEAIFFIPPLLEIDSNFSALYKAYKSGYIETLFNFNVPNKFTNLYEVNRRIDSAHLNHQGAQEFTLLLASEFKQHLNNSEEKLVSSIK
ncbi:hypothetical protein I8752_35200 [Nostocaceae cyanobacterium CENA369]|uniref:DUF1574 domain-containing protein n=1 Tax=Dendronalium phyllosphericum CENA369 TaxID=1725256 RepID=A0A8J7IVJ0_9NOST|nr:hypothetical protein [Dendronalium phyllosphericum]MBH8578102.1 hypothetical protein [Dendronalium phyllosphericum CENA369]